METHPDLITNGQVARQTMTSINHPGVRVNFDTANVYGRHLGVGATERIIGDWFAKGEGRRDSIVLATP